MANYANYRKNDIERNLEMVRFRPLDVLVVGGTGAGKSSTINSLFATEVSKVGRGWNPETMDVTAHELNDTLRFWDSPGLGDGKEADKKHKKKLIDTLYEDYYLEGGQYGLIDLVLVLVDGSNRDMGTVYSLLNDIIVPNFQADRILIAINQADMAMKGKHWNEQLNCPDCVLSEFLEEKVDSIVVRVKEGTGIKVKKPVFYSAERNFHVQELMVLIIDSMPKERRKLVGQY